MKKIMIGFVGVLLVPGLLFGYPGHGKKGGEHHEKMMTSFFEELHLTASQEKQIDAIREEKKEAREALKELLHDKHDDLKDEMHRYESDSGVVYRLVDEISDLHKEKMLVRTDAMLKIKDVLTEKQFEELREMMEDHHEKMKAKKEKWRDCNEDDDDKPKKKAWYL